MPRELLPSPYMSSFLPRGALQRVVALTGLVAILSLSRSVRADESEPKRPAFELRPGIDLPIMGVSAVIAGSWLLRNEFAPPTCAPTCDRARVDKFDRWAAGRYDPAMRTASDIGVFAILGASAITLFADEGFSRGGSDTLVIGEAILASNALATTMMWATRRARPFSYGTSAPLERRLEGNAAMSFFSGHTAASFASVIGLHRALHALHPNASSPWIALGLGLSAASFVGVSRMLAGDHFPTDVLAGAATGIAFGYLVPSAHEWKVRPILSESGLGVVGVF